MPDVFTREKRSEVMSLIRGRGNKETEIALMKIFRRNKISGWRRHVLLKFPLSKAAKARGVRAATVRPDFVFSKLRLVVLVDGCFWHGCPKHSNLPVNNRSFWRKKLTGNRVRDRLVNRLLRRHGWHVIRIWEHELTRSNEAALMRRIYRVLI